MDRLVVERGLVTSREKARRLILAGEVLVDETPVDKPGTLVPDTASVRLRSTPKPYVSRGGEKLEGALEALAIDVRGARALDVGASTGGFTDCLLKRGAAHVTALDVGRGQMDWKLVADPRVVAMEKVNARYLEPSDFPEPFEPFDVVTIDVSFISLQKVFPAVAALLRSGGRVLALVKPQFELGPEDVGKGGLVTSPERRFEAVRRAARAAAASGLAPRDVVASPIAGATGNQEYFLYAEATAGAPAETGWNDIDRRAKKACGWEGR